MVYFPTRDQVLAVGEKAALGIHHPAARTDLLQKIQTPPSDWDARTLLCVPGPVWNVSSDTCETGRFSAPDNIAYDHWGREFVFRQPRTAEELAAIMRADADEVLSCYRYDGLDRWTPASVRAWVDDLDVLLGYVRHVLAGGVGGRVPEGLAEFEAYVSGPAFDDYISALEGRLSPVMAA